ncbi:MAG: hypothetical protein K9G49_10530 [Taibaiella sp.]|nr:hypothetical protein [Taibaiella sp.]
MKPLFILLILSVTHCAVAQDFCKQIKKEVSDNKTITELSSPYDLKEIPMMRVTRNISTDEDAPFDNFSVIFRVLCGVDDIYGDSGGGGKTEKEEKKLTIIFEDNSRIVDDTVDIMHDLTEDRTEAIRYVYYPIIPETANDFSTKKISKFIIAGQEKEVPADLSNALMQYARCIKTAK